MSEPPQYTRESYHYADHCRRYRRRVEAMPKPLTCQECGGAGGHTEYISWELGGPWEDCGMCYGTGLLTPYDRALWLRWKRQEKREAADA